MRWQYVRSVVEDLRYDFRQFEIENFIQHLEAQRARSILCTPYDFRPDVTGVWIPAETADYIFYSRYTHPVHQIHIVLHEIAHMLLKHEHMKISEVLPVDTDIFHLTRDMGFMNSSSIQDDQQEQEAEAFVYLIQQQLVAARRFDQLTRAITSIKGLDRFTDTLGWMG
ncbi:MAG: ImmA/IrrE family metallo-endopeptidase [Chloroflexi bacterium]|nr:ImmA/IrrE family metallo-endopeptidase [Chloroflexota bacterium]